MPRKSWKALAAHHKKRDELLSKKPSDWTAAELISQLTERYQPSKIPPCSVCGGKMGIVAAGGGEPTAYACTGRDKDGNTLPGRSMADEHYSQSRYLDRRHGDSAVIELIRRFKTTLPKKRRRS
jgi:hypothetical protein